MKKRVLRLSAGVLIGMAILVAIIWMLDHTLGNMTFPELFAGKPLDYWQQQLSGRDAAASNAALAVAKSELVPQLVNTMFHDTNDFTPRVWLVKALNGLPGVEIYYVEAPQRRTSAARYIGELGPAAGFAVPELIRALKATDPDIRESVIQALGKIHDQPDTVIPLLISYLEDEDVDGVAAEALSQYGSLAKAAVPKLLPLLNAKDKDDRAAAQEALLKIDPEAAAAAGLKPRGRSP